MRHWLRRLGAGPPGPPAATAQRPAAEPLEQRLLFSADPFSASAGAAPLAEVRIWEQVPAVAVQTRVELLVVDARVPEAQTLIDDLTARLAEDGVALRTLLLTPDSDGLIQIDRAVQAAGAPLSAVHVISHGDSGMLLLGDRVLDAAGLQREAERLTAWRSVLTPDADILLYGCRLGAGEPGQAFLQTLAELTGADVAASDDATGSAASGDGTLEQATGPIEHALRSDDPVWASLQTPLASFFVVNTADSGPGSLRQAIIDAELNPGNDTIAFAIAGAGPQTITLASALPQIHEGVTLDASTQPGYAGVPLIAIDGSVAAVPIGLDVQGVGASFTVVKGLTIQGFTDAGISVNGADHLTIEDNRIGTTLDGLGARGNGLAGLVLGGAHATVQRNLISGQSGSGIVLPGSGHDNLITGNTIGLGADGRVLGNGGAGILVQSGHNIIGGLVPSDGNTVAGSGAAGIAVAGAGARANAILANRISGSAGLAIDLGNDGVSANDGLGDPDAGANDLQNMPVITDARWSPGSGELALQGSLSAQAGTAYRIDVYLVAPAETDPSGYGEAARWAGSVDVLADGTGLAVLNARLAGVSVSVADRVTATATEIIIAGPYGNTSELSLAVAVQVPGVTVGAVSGPVAEDGRSASFTVVLDTAPDADVVIPVSTADAGEGVADVTRLVFTPANWSTPQTVTVTGVDDALDDGDQSFAVVLGAASSADVHYDGLDAADPVLVNLDNDATPVITANGGGDTAAVSRLEGQTQVLTLTATDADLPAQALSWSIVGGADAALFRLDPVTGVLSFASSPSHAAPGDAGADNVYDLTVGVTDTTGLADHQSLSITVLPDVFVQGRYLELGVSPGGALGSSSAAPAGFVRASLQLGAVSDPQRDGWASHDGDFVMPGTPLDAWGVQVAGLTLMNQTRAAPIVGQVNAAVTPPGTDGVVWVGATAELAIDHRITVADANLYADVQVTLTNTSGADLTDLYYFRHVDPDNNFDQNGIFDTQNTIVSQGDIGGVALVTASQPDGSMLGLMGLGANARVAIGHFGDVVPAEAWAGVNGHQASGSLLSDVGVTLVYRIPLLASGASVTLDMRYLFAASPTPYLDLDANDSSATGLDSASAFVEGGASVRIADADALISDTDSPTLSGMVATLLNPLDGGFERLSADTQGTAITASWDGQTLTLSGTDSAAAYQAVLRSLTYDNRSDNPNTTARQIRISISDGANASALATATVTLTAVNDEQVVAVNAGLSISENALGQTIGAAQLSTTDPDQTPAQLVYTLTSAPQHGSLVLIGLPLSAGSSFTQADIDAGRLAYDHDGSETTVDGFDFSVDDGFGSASVGHVALSIAPVDDQTPVIVSDGGGPVADLSVLEGQVAVSTVLASDGDLPPAPLSYRIAGGADAGAFAIDAASGALRFVAAPDREQPTDANGDNLYELSVVASDGTHDSAAQALRVRVLNTDEAPVVVAAAFGLGQGGAVVLNASLLRAVDVDTPPSGLLWTVTQLQGGRFERVGDATRPITQFTQQDVLDGGVRFVHDGRTPTPAVQLSISDASTTLAPVTASIGVTAVAAAPLLSLAAPDAVVDGSFEAADPAWSGNSWRGPAGYRIPTSSLVPAAGQWSVAVEGDPIAAAVSAIEQTIATSAGQAYVLSLQTISRLGLVTGGDIGAITIDGVERLRFVAGDSWQAVSVGFVATTAQTRIGIVSLGSNRGPAAAGNDGVGVVVDDVQVHAVDTAVATSEDAAVVPLAPGARWWPADAASAGPAALTITIARASGPQAEDLFGATGTLGALVAGAALTVDGAAVGTVDSNGAGTLVLGIAPGASVQQVERVLQQIGYRNSSPLPPAGVTLHWRVTAAGGAGPALAVDADVQVSIASIPDAPVFVAPGPVVGGSAALDLPENTQDVATAVATDADSATPTLRFGIAGGADAALFEIDPVGGQLRLRQAADAERPADADGDNVYELRLRVSDPEGSFSELDLRVRITDVNESPSLALPAEATVLQGALPNTPVAQAVGLDPDAAQTLRYALVDDAGGAFAIDASTGLITVADASQIDAARHPTLTLVVAVDDGAGLSVQRSLSVRVIAVPGEGGAMGPFLPPAAPASPVAAPGEVVDVAAVATAVGSTGLDTPAPAADIGAASSTASAASGGDARRRSLSERAVLNTAPATELRLFRGPGDAGSGIHRQAARDDELAATEPVPTEVSVIPVRTNFALTRALLNASPETNGEASSAIDDLIGRSWGAGRRSGGSDEAANADGGGDGGADSARRRAQLLLLDLTAADKMAGVSLTAGFVWWLTRGGGALATVLMGVPAWRQIDLLPVMARDGLDEDLDELEEADETDSEEGTGRKEGEALFEPARRQRRTVEVD